MCIIIKLISFEKISLQCFSEIIFKIFYINIIYIYIDALIISRSEPIRSNRHRVSLSMSFTFAVYFIRMQQIRASRVIYRMRASWIPANHGAGSASNC